MKFVIVFAALLAIAVALPRDAAEGDAEIANGLLSLITSVVKQVIAAGTPTVKIPTPVDRSRAA